MGVIQRSEGHAATLPWQRQPGSGGRPVGRQAIFMQQVATGMRRGRNGRRGALRPGLLRSMIYSYFSDGTPQMSNAVKKTISLPADLARQAEALAQAEGKTLSGVIQDALRQAGIERRLQELSGMQAFWSRKARDKGILTEKDLARYLAN